MIQRHAACLLALVAALAGCVDVSGGAVELSWTFYDREGTRRSCAAAGVDRLRLEGVVVDGSDAPAYAVEWPCDEGRGATPFDIQPGRYAFRLAPICKTGVLDATVPEPIVRDIVEGDVASLRALLIVGNQPEGLACR
jgi:hypothetical protein